MIQYIDMLSFCRKKCKPVARYPRKGVVESFRQTENKGVNLCKHLLSLLVIGTEGYVRYDLLLQCTLSIPLNHFQLVR